MVGHSRSSLRRTGVAAAQRQSRERFDLNVAAVVTLSLDDVSALSRRIGPVTGSTCPPRADLRSGFHGGPGPVELVGDRAVSFLRSRHWETFDGSDWSLTDASDAGRIDHLHIYVEAAIDRIRGSGPESMARLDVRSRAGPRRPPRRRGHSRSRRGYGEHHADPGPRRTDPCRARGRRPEIATGVRPSRRPLSSPVAPEFSGLADGCSPEKNAG